MGCADDAAALGAGPSIDAPTMTTIAAGDETNIGTRWLLNCRHTKPAIGSGTVSCPHVDIAIDATCSRDGCTIGTRQEADADTTVNVQLPKEPGPLDVRVAITRKDNGETFEKSVHLELKKLDRVELQCRGGGFDECQKTWANLAAKGTPSSMVIGVGGVADDGLAVGVSFQAAYTLTGEPEPTSRHTVRPYACGMDAACIDVRGPSTLELWGPAFAARYALKGSGELTRDLEATGDGPK